MRLSEHRYKTISSIAGPLLFVQGIFGAKIGEVVKIYTPDRRQLDGEVLEINEDRVLIEVFAETQGLDIEESSIVLTDSIRRAPLSPDIIGRVFNGSFAPVDDLPMFLPEKRIPITGFPINPTARARPEEFIETGVSVIDGLNTLVKGQKLPVFSCSGLPSREVVAAVLKNSSRAKAEGGDFIIVFTALGLTFHEYSFYMNVIKEMQSGFVAFINMADEPAMERLLAPRFALTVAEYLAFDKGMDVLVIITDMTNYCDALREVSTAREELPGRRGYPGFMYSDLASLYERAGRIKGLPGLTGYITEGQIVLSRDLHQKGVFPPVDVLPSLSRLMQRGIGEGHTRADHRSVSNLLYKNYAKGRDLRRLEAIIGREGMSADDKLMLDFADAFEKQYVNQGMERRDINESLDGGINLLKQFNLET
jgi:V/A-type H+-transporting ATPase subunit B